MASGTALPASALAPSAPLPAKQTTALGDPVVGIPDPCLAQHEWPSGVALSEVKRQLEKNVGIDLVGPYWTDESYRPMVKIIWETLDALSCTDYLATIKKTNPDFQLNAGPISGWAFGDWGLTKPGAVTLDLAKWQEPYRLGDRGRLVRLTVHELGHAWSRTPEAQPAYEKFGRMYAHTGNFSNYGQGSANENFSEVIGYFVARCANGNPYDSAVRNHGQFDDYYELVKDEVFGGREFGPEVGETPNCSLEPRPRPVAEKVKTLKTPAPARAGASRVEVERVLPGAEVEDAAPATSAPVTRVLPAGFDR